MSEKVLLVDDEPSCLAAYRRSHGRTFQLDTEGSGQAGLAALAERGPYAVVVSDMRMPGMDGVTFLKEVRRRWPNTIRVMLTGNADQQTAAEAVNQGAIFCFLNKPCEKEAFTHAVRGGIEQHRRLVAEQELLQDTLNGSIKVLVEILSIVNPDAFGRAMQMREIAREVSQRLHVDQPWEIEMAVMLSPIGYMTIPGELLIKSHENKSLSDKERQLLAESPRIGHRLLSQIPRLKSVAEIILYQNKRYDGSGFPEDDVAGEQIPLGSRILQALSDLTDLVESGVFRADAIRQMSDRAGWYDPAVLKEVCTCTLANAGQEPVSVSAMHLRVNQVIAEDVVGCNGTLVIRAGSRITPMIRQSLQNYAALGRIDEQIQVFEVQ